MTSADAAVSTAEDIIRKVLASTPLPREHGTDFLLPLAYVVILTREITKALHNSAIRDSARNDALEEAHEKLTSMEASKRELAELFRKKDDLDGVVAYSQFANAFALAASAVRAMKSRACTPV